MSDSLKERISSFFIGQQHIAPLAVFRIAFGSIMLLSTIRFVLKGWVYAFYIKPKFHFTFYGFERVQPLGATGMYCLFGLLIVSSLLIALGLFYRVAILTFFLCFTYVELIDKTTYLNHYYFISILAFLLILVPANRYFSVDVLRKPLCTVTQVPTWTISIFKLQLLLIYFFAGLSKLNYDWLIAALPLRIWLPANSHLPIIGPWLTQLWVAYAFSWFGALFDLCVGFFLLWDKTRKPAYAFVVLFHLATGLLFKIGVFPYIMIAVTPIFFSEKTHIRIIQFFRNYQKPSADHTPKSPKGDFVGEWLKSPLGDLGVWPVSNFQEKLIWAVLGLHFTIQLLLPFRFLLYPGKLYWTEEGYRFSWRVMLMEKGGTAFFHVKDPATGRQSEIVNAQYLTPLQETMMATQPDMILQYAHFLAKEYEQKGIKNPIVTAESYVTLNGSGSRLYIDSTINLATEQETFGHKPWILPFRQ